MLAGSNDTVGLGGITPDYVYGTNMGFNNSGGDAVRVMLPDQTVIDVVDFQGSGWSSSYGNEGHSMQYSGSPPSATDNDSPTLWCASQNAYGTGASFGTPGAATDCVP